jgi:uncharacterized protein YndB with AHSA1/START domain
MTNTLSNKRIDTASRHISAPAQKIYAAFLDPVAVAKWRPPEGMTCKIYEFQPHEQGTFRMSFAYKEITHELNGKTSEHEDVFHGRFAELVPGERIVELVEFESEDPAFAGTMKITTDFLSEPGGTEVTIVCENVPDGIRPDDHYKGMASTLKKLAAFTE